MGNLFKQKTKESKTVRASAPEEDETDEEIKHIEDLSNSDNEETKEVKASPKEKESISYREIPVCLSQTQINNLVIENNIILKQIISNMDD